MRELILKMSVSLDSFVGGPEGEAGWVFGNDPQAVAWTVDVVSNASLHIMGSRTFRDMAAHWPCAVGPFAAPMNQIPKAVFSKRGSAVLQATAESWAQAHVAGGDLADEIAQLKAGDGKPVIAHGGASFARSLIAQNLIDEYALMVHPIALGRGLPIFSDLQEPRRLKLVSSKAFAGGSVAQVYRPA